MEEEPKGKTRRTSKVTTIDGPKAFSFQHAESQIELVLVHVDPEAMSNDTWRTLEFWTANTMYGLDASLRCIEISGRNPHGPPAPTHLIGALLVGSQNRQGDDYSVSFPYPVPGMDAVFQIGDAAKYMTTSKVERVMLRVRMTNFTTREGQKPDWSKITAIGHETT